MTEPQRPINSEDRYWARQALALGESSLKDVRATAEKWRSGLTSLTGVLTTALAVASPFIGKTVTSGPARIALLVFAALAVGALGKGTWAAMSAAFGTPTEINGDGESLRTWSEQAAKTAVEQLECARRMTVAGFALLVVAACVGLICADSESAPELSHVVLNDGTEYCGSLSFRDDGKSLAVTGDDGTVHSATIVSVATVQDADDCD